MKKRKDILQQTHSSSPEAYWIQRKSNIVGEATLKELSHGRQIDTYHSIFDVVSKYSVTQVVDLGCNIATLGRLFYAWGYGGNYTGVDSNLYALHSSLVTELIPSQEIGLICANIRMLPFPSETFQCVVLKDVLEHMEDFRPFLYEAARVSSKYVIVSNFIPWTEGNTIIRREPQGYYHNLYARTEVYDFAQQLGLEVKQIISTLEKDARPNEIVVFEVCKK
jgi:ubiquinone/menaquinone biosynthesis C-methylase UbiE